MTLALDALTLAAITAAVAALTAPAFAWLDGRSSGITAQHSRTSSAVQGVVTTVAFTVAYACTEHVPAFAVLAGIAVLLGLALGGEIQAERLHRRAARITG
ncbi:hypothetical protein EV189_1780 [Motilibacter rhizosphaerae]|uniref:Uncharacterized protein n=1 Tax=Motilibacter rhizosphaerae TaxID=598652 RepID=A0A4Q7NT75_9ACTN|nr:hypothetical protein [Motilibacter rhizosphaerae]RZS89998.1 hypothetical protein EV189_1780 [Motilibacter rhizosphaerae]